MSYEVVARDWRDTLGEGPVWVPRSGCLLWVDIVAPCINSFDLASGAVNKQPMPEPVGWVLPRAGRNDMITGLKSGFAFVDLASGAIVSLGDPEPDRPDNRMNDAKVDAWGRVWAGTKDETDQTASGSLYRLDPDLRWSRHDDGYGVTNGPTFSLDGTVMYHTDSAVRTIYAFDLADDGTLHGKRVWLTFDDAWGYPDGMTTDGDGCLWIAHWDGGRISRFSPEGALMRSITLPASNITSCAFAGPDLDRLFVTSSTIDRENEPLAGALFEVDPEVCGLVPREFAG